MNRRPRTRGPRKPISANQCQGSAGIGGPCGRKVRLSPPVDSSLAQHCGTAPTGAFREPQVPCRALAKSIAAGWGDQHGKITKALSRCRVSDSAPTKAWIARSEVQIPIAFWELRISRRADSDLLLIVFGAFLRRRGGICSPPPVPTQPHPPIRAACARYAQP